ICAQSLLSASAHAVQAHGDIEIDGRVSPVSEFHVSIAASGERKTATDRVATAPHAERQRELKKEFTEKKAAYELKIAAWKKAREDALSSRNSTLQEKEEALKALGSEPQPPLEAIITTSDVTIEGVIKTFANGWPSLSIFNDEGGQFTGGYGME